MKNLFLLPFLLFFIFGHNDNKSTNKVQPVLIRGPYLQSVTDSSIIIRWRTDVLARSRVSYGTEPGNLSQSVNDINRVTEHEIKLSNLEPETKYYYSIGGLKDILQGGENDYFETLPITGKQGDYFIGAFGDCGYLGIAQTNVKNAFLKQLGRNYLNAWILLGDNAYNDGTDAEYQAKFFNPYKELLKKYPLFSSPGNHDYHDIDFSADYAQNNHTTAYFHVFSMPVEGESGGVPSLNKDYYSYDIGNIHFLSLDSYGKEEKKYYLYDTLGPQMEWVKKDLEANKNKDWVIVYTHFPPYSMGSHNSDTESGLYKIRQNVLPILERYGVDLMICGHSHVYERSKLMRGYYGNEAAFDSSKYDLSYSSGLYNGSKNSCPYIKGPDDKGTVYVVSGSSSIIGKPQSHFPHAAMVYGNASIEGAGLIRVRGSRLDFNWICADGAIRDKFTMMKNVNKTIEIHLKKGQTTTLTASFVSNEYTWNKSNQKGRSIEVKPSAAKITYVVKDQFNCLKDIYKITVSK